MRDLIDADGYQLIDGDGYALDESCAEGCCEPGCALWRMLRECVSEDCDGNIPQPMELWVCDATLVCSRGQFTGRVPIGGVIRIDGACFEVTDQEAFAPPPGARTLDPPPPEGWECYFVPGLPSCRHVACPQGPLWYPAYLCAEVGFPNPRKVWVCSALRGCNVHARSEQFGGNPWCIVVDGSRGVRYDEIPRDPPPLGFFNVTELGPVIPSCCECEGIVACQNLDVAAFDPGQSPCHQAVIQLPCCCSAPSGVATTTFRVTRHRTEQIVVDSRGPSFTGRVLIEQIGACPYRYRACVEGFGNETHCFEWQEPDVCPQHRCPGFWPAVAPRLFSSPLNPQMLNPPWDSPTCGVTDEPGLNIVATLTHSYECNRFAQTGQYTATYTPPQMPEGHQRVVMATFEYEAVIEGPNECAGLCAGVIGGGTPAGAGGGGVDFGGVIGGVIGGAIVGGVGRFMLGFV